MFILPLNEDRYVGRTPYVIIGLAIANGLTLAATYLLASPQLVFSRYGFTPAQPHILTMFSSLFLHAGIFHYLGNMFFLWMFGYRIENTFGRWLFVLVFLLCGCWTPLSFQPNVHHAVCRGVRCYFRNYGLLFRTLSEVAVQH